MIRPIELTASAFRNLSLQELAQKLRSEAAYERSGRTAATVARGETMTTALTVARAGTMIREHDAPGPVTLVVLEGALSFRSPNGDVTLAAHDIATFAGDVRHSVEAIEDSTFLIVIGGRQED